MVTWNRIRCIHVDQTNSKAVRQTHTHMNRHDNHDLQWIRPTNTGLRDKDRSMQQAAFIHHWFIYLIFPSKHMHLFAGLLVISAQTHCSYCNSSPDQASQHSKEKTEPTQSGPLWHLLALKTAAPNISSSPNWSTSKVRKSIVVGWGLGFPVDIGRSVVKRSKVYFSDYRVREDD